MKNFWTKEEIEILKKSYENQLPLKDIQKLINRSLQAISIKARDMGFTELCVRKNSINYKAIYQEYDWCYDHFINKGMDFPEMAEEAGTSLRTIQKWCGDIHKLNYNTYKYIKKLNEKQKEIISIGIIGDGHIDKRPEQSIYIESHAEDEKDYLFWKYEFLKDLCHHEPVYSVPCIKILNDKSYQCQGSYRLSTRSINDLATIREMSRINIIQNITEFQLCLLLLDDGYRGTNWELCVAAWSNEEKNSFLSLMSNKFNINCHITSDPRYILFNSESSRKIDSMILKYVPNNLDIILKKIINNSKIRRRENAV